MARIAGVDLPNNKRAEVALTYIYGIGPSISKKVLAEANKLQDTRCHDALELLESKRLVDGGFPKEEKYCQSSNPETSYFTPADWKSVNRRKTNEWVTIDALFILKNAKRIDIDY